jgi:hopene-associated glycosyltransferase HpnB
MEGRMVLLALATILIWAGLLAARDGFWLARETDEEAVAEPHEWPEVVAIVPARDEVDVIGRAIASLAAQDYPGAFRMVVVDDGSSDGTADAARAVAPERLTVISASPPPGDWTGKLWAMQSGIEEAGTSPRYLWLTDADIEHAPGTLRSLVARAESDGLAMNSLMALLRCESVAEKALVPAFVFFFQMLYPFARVNHPGSRVAAAAGGCMLVNRAALVDAGGLREIKRALIDDCALGALMKTEGPIRLTLTRRCRSIRPYRGFAEIGAMISRSAYAQLGYSPLLLLGTLAGMAIVYVSPLVLAVTGPGWLHVPGGAAWVMMASAFQPMLRFYGRSPLWGFALPFIGLFYAGATWSSAWRHWHGRGGMWKGRAQARARST